MEELGLRAFLAGEKLDVVDQQHVHRSVALAEIEHAIVADGVDHLVHEPLGRNVGEFQVAIVLQHVMSDGVHQVRLAEADPAVDEERVIRARRRLRDRPAGRVGELVRRSDDEGVEGVARVQSRRTWLRDRRRPCFERRGFFGAEGDDHAVGHRIGDEIHQQIRPLELDHGLGNHAGVVLGQPVLEQGIWDADGHRRATIGDKLVGRNQV